MGIGKERFMRPKVSLLTLVRGRRAHLENLLRFVMRQEQLPDELVIAVMEDTLLSDLPDLPFPIRQFLVPGDELPLARARNEAVRHSQGEHLIFLDVDCLPTRRLVENYSKVLSTNKDGIFMGEVFYLPALDASLATEKDFGETARRHPSKVPYAGQEVEEEPDFGELWGLSFALHRDCFASAGGFDERFYGYGGEETDFGCSLQDAGYHLFRVPDAAVYHQHHPVSIPPLPHFDSIVRNATLFHQKRGRWCMDYWLDQFATMGLITWGPDSEEIVTLRQPTSEEVAKSHQENHIRFS